MNEDKSSALFYLLAAAIVLPIGYWLKANYASEVGYFILSLGGILY